MHRLYVVRTWSEFRKTKTNFNIKFVWGLGHTRLTLLWGGRPLPSKRGRLQRLIKRLSFRSLLKNAKTKFNGLNSDKNRVTGAAVHGARGTHWFLMRPLTPEGGASNALTYSEQRS